MEQEEDDVVRLVILTENGAGAKIEESQIFSVLKILMGWMETASILEKHKANTGYCFTLCSSKFKSIVLSFNKKTLDTFLQYKGIVI